MSEEKFERTEIAEYGEFKLIEHLTEDAVLRHESSQKGIGDDAAVIGLKPDERSIISTDMMVEGIHFDLSYMPLKHLGYKAVVTNLSDIYAMNATPQQITVSIAISNRFSVEALEVLYSGIYQACNHYNVDLVGGDTTSSNKGLIISITALGKAKDEEIVYRSGARPGDLICVSGDLGGAYLGLQLLEREKQVISQHPELKPDLEDQKYVVGRQLKPEARKDIIQMFKEYSFRPTSMIDISDGLASEIFHICHQSKVGAVLFEEQIPLHQESKLLALKFQLDPVTCALSGGEDYELLFTASANDLDKVRSMPDIYVIGDIVKGDLGIKLRTEHGKFVQLEAQGWNHFNT